MPRCRFVDPDVVRLYLVEVHRRAHAALLALPPPKTAKARTAFAEALADAVAHVAQAEADGEFLDVKKQLTAGEARHAFSRQIQSMNLGEQAVLDPEQVGKSKLVAYIVGWSLVDKEGSPVPFSEEALDSVDPATFAEIRAAIDAHEAQGEAERSARKNETDGERPSSATSPSPSTTAGATSGSVN